MSHFFAGLREWISSEAKQKPDSSKREFPSLRFSEPESFQPAIGVSLISGECQALNCMEDNAFSLSSISTKYRPNRQWLLLVWLMLAITTSASYKAVAQCANSTQFPASAFAAPIKGAGLYIISALQKQSQYNQMTGVEEYSSFISTASIAGTWITVREGSVSGPLVAQGITPLSWSSSLTGGTFFIHYNTNSACGTASTFMNTTVENTEPACSMPYQIPAFEISAPIKGTGPIITTGQTRASHNYMNNVVAGSTFQSTASIAGTWITVRAGSVDGTVISQGTTPLTWNAAAGGAYTIHYTVNSACSFSFSTMTSTIENTTPVCANPDQFPTSAFAAPIRDVGPYTITTGQFQKEYNQMTGTLAGSTFKSTASIAGTWITVRAGNATGAVVAQGSTPLNWTASAGGTYFIHYNTNSVCGTASTLMTSTVENTTPACGANNSPFPSAFAAPIKGVGPYTINNGQFQSEYNQMTGTLAGSTFKSTASIAGTWITVRAGTYTGALVAQGSTPLDWTASAGGTYFIHYNTNSACGTANINMTSTVENTTPACGANNSPFPSAFAAPIKGAGPYTITTGQEQKQYNQMTGALAGNTFRSTAGIAGTWITIRSNGTVVAQGSTPLDWTASAGGTYFILYNTNSACGVASTPMTSTVQNTTPACDYTVQYPTLAFAAPIKGAGPQTTTGQTQSQYNQMTGALAGSTFRSTASISGTWITVRAGSPSGTGPLVATGSTPLDWTARDGVTYFIQYNTNSVCGTASTPMTTTVENTTPECANGVQYPVSAFEAPIKGFSPYTTSGQTQAQYNQMTGALAGSTFHSTASIAGTWITVRAGTATGPLVAQGSTPLNWTASAGGTYFIHYNTNSLCGTATTGMTTTVENTTPICANSTQFPTLAFAAPNKGAGPYPITTEQYQEDYNQMTGALAGSTFQSTASISGTWITVRAGNVTGALVAQGITPLDWTASAGGTYFIHYNTNSVCGVASTPMTTTVENTTPVCANSTQFPTLAFAAPIKGAGPQTTTGQTQSQYNQMTGALPGNTFQSTASIAGTWITVRVGTATGALVAQGSTPLIWTAAAGGTYFIHYNTNSVCGTANTAMTTTVENTTPVCANSTQFPTLAFAAPIKGDGPYPITTEQYQSEYNQMTGALAGSTFQSTASISGTWITVRAGTATGALVAQGSTPLIWTAAAGGTYFIHYNTNSACGTANINMTSTVENTTPFCTNSTQYPPFEIPLPTKGAGPVNIYDTQWAGDYNQMTGALAGSTFQSTASIAGTWITVLEGTSTGALVAQGSTPLNWTASAGGTYFIHYNTNSVCGTANTPMTTTVENTTTPVCTIELSLASQTNASCNGGSNGAASINEPTGGTGEYTYDWTPGNPSGDGTRSVTGLTAGTWICTVTDANNCSQMQSFTITEPSLLQVFEESQTNVSCDGGNDGAASIFTPTGGTPGYTYNWTPGNPTGDGTRSVTGLSAGTWTCTVTDNNGCTKTRAVLIETLNTSSTPITAVSVPSSNCPNTTVTLTASGGISGTGSIIKWYSGPNGTGTLLGTGNSIIVSPTGTSTYYVRREGLCNTTADFSVVVNVKSFSYAANGTSSSNYCTDNSGWNHFYVGDEIILSVRGNLSNAGTITATIQDNDAYYFSHGSSGTTSCSCPVELGDAKFEMERNWNLNLGGGTLSGTYEVRFYYRPSERTAVINAAAAWITANPTCGYTYKYNTLAQGWFWFKNQGSPYSAPDYDDDPTFLMLTSAGNGTTPNGINYSTLSGITSFSGGSGAIVLFPNPLLPISTQATETIVACGSYAWHDSTYTASTNTATWTGTNAAGCDSIVTLNLTINQPSSSTETIVACGSYNWRGTTYTSSNNTATWTGINAAGCDSIVTLNLTINNLSNWYRDADGDGYYTNMISSCTNPGAGYTKTQGTEGDCNDTDNSIWRTGDFYTDTDGDNYTVGTVQSLCYGASSPAGYSANSLGADCDDTNNSIWQTGDFYTDADGDNYTVGEMQSLCYGAITPSGYSVNSLGTDCNDTNNSIWRTGDFYTDADGDNYTVGTVQSLCYGASSPAGYSANSLGTDCDDTNNSIWQTGDFYTDADGDNYTVGTVQSLCYGASSPAGYSANSLGADCDDTNNSIWQTGDFYTDADGDNYTVGTVQSLCYGASSPAGYSANSLGTDCNDTNAQINPGASEICNRIDDNCDGIVDFGPIGTPVSINGPSVVCRSQSYVFTTDAVAGAVQYIWYFAPGMTGANFTTTNSNTVAMSSTFTGGPIGVEAVGPCGVISATVFKTVTAVTAASATPGTITGTTAVCANSTEYTFNITAVANASNYVWTAPANATLVSGQGTTTATFIFQSAYTTGSISVRSSNCIGTSAARTLTVAKKSISSTPLTVTGPASICAGTQQTFSIAAVSGASNYTWTAPANASIVSGQGSLSVVVEFTPAFVSGNVTVASSNCSGTSTARTKTVTKSVVPGTVGVISGVTAGACSANTRTYTVAALTNTTSYDWIAPVNASILSGQGTTSVVVQFAAGFTTGTLSVKGVNCSGTSVTARTLALSNVTATPTVLTGPATAVCAGSTQTYSTTAVTGQTTNVWTVPTGAVINGPNNGISISVTFPSPFTTGAVTVKSATSCYTSAAKSLTVYSVPVAPASITGTTIGVCGGSTQTYTCPVSTTGATSYNWTVPTGAVILTGATTNSITVQFPTPFVSGAVSVKAYNTCGESVAKSITVSSAITQPGVISGASTNLCSGGSFTYSIAAVTGATGYFWSVPAGWNITANTGTSVTVSIPTTGFTTATLSVAAQNACGYGIPRTLALSALPATPTAITGSNSVCPSATGLVYSTPAVSGVSYTWTVPTGASITAGQGTNSIEVTWGSVAGSVTVKAGNACGTNGTSRSLAVTLSLACREAVDEVAETINETIRLYPNPASQTATLSFGSAKESDYQIRVINALGQSVYSSEGKATEGANTIGLNLEKLSSGLYIVQLVKDGTRKQVNLIKR